MSLHILLKFSVTDPNNPEVNTIQEHLKILREKGSVWWGKFGKGMADQKYEVLRGQIQRSILTYAFLYQGSKPQYKARVTKIYKEQGGADVKGHCPEANLVPSYYRQNPQSVWFKFDEMKNLEENFDINKHYEKLNGEEVSLTGQSALLFIKPKREGLVIIQSPNDSPKNSPEPRSDLSTICSSFASALRKSNISFGPRHNETVRSFIASLATKHFVILTGLSGSGKTQIAIKLGEWLGEDRFFIVPVRPDWTGSEAIFGYEDALQPCSPDGRRAWYVPKVLEFMLKAARDPENPYLLILDEMNLAHVERYFADVLSGMESMQPCLPNLRFEDGNWRMVPGDEDRLPYPTNLFVVGTVNVDETTYMFSPKVLDRANTFEFRVNTTDLSARATKPKRCEAADLSLVRGFLTIAEDENWHLGQPLKKLNIFLDHLRNLHSLLSEDGFEFGHRVFYEAVRFAAMHEAAGDGDPEHALDLQVMQKLLPRLHGSRRRLESTLCALGQFCFDLTFEPFSEATGTPDRFNPLKPPEGEPRLPMSFDKIRRMTQSLRANQFASFTE